MPNHSYFVSKYKYMYTCACTHLDVFFCALACPIIRSSFEILPFTCSRLRDFLCCTHTYAHQQANMKIENFYNVFVIKLLRSWECVSLSSPCGTGASLFIYIYNIYLYVCMRGSVIVLAAYFLLYFRCHFRRLFHCLLTFYITHPPPPPPPLPPPPSPSPPPLPDVE